MKREDFKIEVCANSVESVWAAQKAGADRVELCAGMPEGGTTPSYACIKMACQVPGIAVNVIIRPRGGDFLYSEEEKAIILEDIRCAKELGASGIVSGMLTENGEVDAEFLRQCVQEAYPLPFTFHRAFDMCNDPFAALKVLQECGCRRLLSSGMKATALEGAQLLGELVRMSKEMSERMRAELSAGGCAGVWGEPGSEMGAKKCTPDASLASTSGQELDKGLIIMPGCGINAGNIAEIARITGAREFHLSGRVSVESGMKFRNSQVSMGGTVHIEEYARDVSSVEKVAAAIRAVEGLGGIRCEEVMVDDSRW